MHIPKSIANIKYIMAIPIFIRFFVSIGRVCQKYHRIGKAKLVKRQNIRSGSSFFYQRVDSNIECNFITRIIKCFLGRFKT